MHDQQVSEVVDQFEPLRPQLTGHCYRMLGSVFDADDAVQETLIRAWRSFGTFDGRSSLKTWLYRIATNVCLDELKTRGRRVRPIDEGEPSSGTPPESSLTQKDRAFWIEPIPDEGIVSPDADPSEQVQMRQSVRLAFISALQKLVPQQRAALLMTEVLGCSSSEVAETLGTTVPSVNSALQRARATLARRQMEQPVPVSDSQKTLLNRYVEAFEAYDVDGLTSLMRQDVAFSMPPYELWLRGPDEVRAWMLGLGAGCRGSRLMPASASGWPAFAQYRPAASDGYRAWALIVLELGGDAITGVTTFLDVDRLFPRFGFPITLPE